jgi:hypothetical protein
MRPRSPVRWWERDNVTVPDFLMAVMNTWPATPAEQILAYATKLDDQAVRLYLSDKRRWRDRRRAAGDPRRLPTISEYRRLIHVALSQCAGRCYLSGHPLAWDLWLIDHSQRQAMTIDRSSYPSFDHEPDTSIAHGFSLRVCSWAMNNAKSDKSLAAFLQVCEDVLRHHRPTSVSTP